MEKLLAPSPRDCKESNSDIQAYRSKASLYADAAFFDLNLPFGLRVAGSYAMHGVLARLKTDAYQGY